MSAADWYPLLPDDVPVHPGCPVVVCSPTGVLWAGTAASVTRTQVRVGGHLVHRDRVQPNLETRAGLGVLLCFVAHYTLPIDGDEWPPGLERMVRRWLTGGTTPGDLIALAHAAAVVSGEELRWDGYRSGVMGLGERVTAEELRMLGQHELCRELFGEGFYERPPSERVALVRVHLSGRSS